MSPWLRPDATVAFVCDSRPVPHGSQLGQAIARSINELSGQHVVYEDVLGEGWGGWHSAPRMPANKTNCIIWLQSVLALSLAEVTGKSRQQVLDSLRYYLAVPAYGMRKHYIEHMLAFDPGPLSLVGPTSSRLETREVTIEPALLKQSRGYGDGYLFEEHKTTFTFPYLSPLETLRLSRELRPGFQVLFAVPSRSFMDTYGCEVGPMGLVHAFILETKKNAPAVLHHASIAFGVIIHEVIDCALDRLSQVYSGFALCNISREWKPPPGMTIQVRRILRREAVLDRRELSTMQF